MNLKSCGVKYFVSMGDIRLTLALVTNVTKNFLLKQLNSHYYSKIAIVLKHLFCT